jgi:hypothetical protein
MDISHAHHMLDSRKLDRHSLDKLTLSKTVWSHSRVSYRTCICLCDGGNCIQVPARQAQLLEPRRVYNTHFSTDIYLHNTQVTLIRYPPDTYMIPPRYIHDTRVIPIRYSHGSSCKIDRNVTLARILCI